MLNILCGSWKSQSNQVYKSYKKLFSSLSWLTNQPWIYISDLSVKTEFLLKKPVFVFWSITILDNSRNLLLQQLNEWLVVRTNRITWSIQKFYPIVRAQNLWITFESFIAGLSLKPDRGCLWGQSSSSRSSSWLYTYIVTVLCWFLLFSFILPCRFERKIW